MASWTDEVPQFNSYIQQQPVEQMTAVGIQRETAFRDGIAKVQSLYDNLLGLPIAKKETQLYVRSKVQELDSAVRSNMMGDFSDQRLQNQIGALGSKIAHDPIVENGVSSTAYIQAGYDRISQAKKDNKGEYALQNEQYFQTQVNQWLNDGDLETSFSGTYTPHFDTTAEFMKLYKEAHPGESLDSKDIYVRNADGSFARDGQGKLVISPTVREGVNANKIANIWNLVTQDPRAQAQLNIDGWYKYRGVSPESMWNAKLSNTKASIDNSVLAIQDLQRKIATDKTVDVPQLTNQINAYKEHIENQKTQFKNFSQLISTNPDAAKADLVNAETLSSLIGAYSYETMKKSPLWEANMESMKYELDLNRFGLEQEKFKYQMSKDDLDRQLEYQKMLRSGKKGKGDGEDEGLPVNSTVENVPEAAGKLGSASFADSYKAKQEELSQAMNQFVFMMHNGRESDKKSGDFNPIKLDPSTGSYVLNIDPTGTTGYKNARDAAAKYRDEYTSARGNVISGTAPSNVLQAWTKVDPLIRDVRDMEAKKKEIETAQSSVIESIKAKTGQYNPDFIEAYIVNNKLPGWENSQSRLRNKYGSDWQQGMGLSTVTEIVNAPGAQPYVRQGKNQSAFTDFNKKFSADLAPQFQAIEDRYKAAQRNFYPIRSTFETGKPEDSRNMRGQFARIASSVTKGNEAYEDFTSLLEPNKGKEDSNIYGGIYDRSANKYYLTVQRGGEQPAQLEVSADIFNSFPELRSTNQFYNMFGTAMNLTNNTTTDVQGDGSNPYIMDRPSDSKYDVRYHVIGDGKGKYDLRLTVKARNNYTDQTTGQVVKAGTDIIKGQPGGFDTSEAGIVRLLQELKNDVYIDAMIPADRRVPSKK